MFIVPILAKPGAALLFGGVLFYDSAVLSMIHRLYDTN